MAEATVTKLHPEVPSAPAPAVGFSVVMNFPGNRQATLQTFFPQEASDAEANALMDRLFRFTDRQSARYEIADMTKELEKHETTLKQFRIDLEDVELNHAKAQADRRVLIDEYNSQAAEIRERAEQDFRKRGKQGAFSPVGNTATNIKRMTVGASQVHAEIEKQEAERAVAVENLNRSIHRFEGVIAELKASIAEKRALSA